MGTEKNITFLKTLLTNSALPPIYNTITYKNTNLFTKKTTNQNNQTVQLTTIKDIPGYLELNLSRNLKNIRINTIKTLRGHLVDLTLFKDFKEYVSKKISPKSKYNLNRYKNRLETCFNTKYVVYHGDIDKKEYDRLFIFLKDFLVRRFQEKKEKNYELQYLQEFHTLCYDMIIQNRANLFVIYNDNTPISIRINMFTNDLAYYIISGYDIDYSKFHLGAIDMLKNIEWCFQNKFKAYDLLKGYDYYKQKWATGSYFNYMQIAYNSGAIYFNMKAHYMTSKERFRQYLIKKVKSYNLDKPYKKIRKFTYKYTNKPQHIKEVKITVKNNIHTKNAKTKINIQTNADYRYLKRYVYNFLFLNKEHFSNTSVYSIADKPNYFEVIGKDNNQLLIVDIIKG
ncbi:GNAT family N-acetyltransferase [Flavivirga aquimarina]|uniref:GNAT family N-acetyltransferase n=1 Tax=Flavivirga aquimarina TaxID=2027862 RepID=A0ABT8WDA8_9FLAO|nr:GNAT family N-acetyltransferase [Flavivirga aquimarina]MDO5971140.1 GNAT family N-acetyltransferase [Flavivirga aquimarina]